MPEALPVIRYKNITKKIKTSCLTWNTFAEQIEQRSNKEQVVRYLEVYGFQLLYTSSFTLVSGQASIWKSLIDPVSPAFINIQIPMHKTPNNYLQATYKYLSCSQKSISQPHCTKCDVAFCLSVVRC